MAINELIFPLNQPLKILMIIVSISESTINFKAMFVVNGHGLSMEVSPARFIRLNWP